MIARPICNQAVRRLCALLSLTFCAATAYATPPTAVNDGPVNVPEDSVNFTINASSNDSDIDGNLNPFSATVFSGPGNGSASSNGNGSFNYTPTTNYFGTDSFVYQICDFAAECSTATVSINVTSVNDQPTANAQSVSAVEDIDKPITLTGSDVETPNNNLTFTVTSGPSRGSLAGSGANLTYSPTANLNGPDSFRFTVTDADGLASAEATVSINVAPTNDPPTVATPIGNQAATENVFFSLAVKDNFTDIDLDPLTFSAVGLPASLAPIGVNNGVINGTPTQAEALAQNGVYAVTVTASDGSQSVSDNFTLTITPVNDPPVANNQNVITDEDTPRAITLTGSDADGDPITFSIATQPTNGTLSGTAPNVTYTPNLNFNGNDSFTFTTNDGIVNSAPGTIAIRVDPVNDLPTLGTPIPDQQAVEASPFNLNISGNFVDVDGDQLNFSIGLNNLPASGNLRFNGNTGVFSGTPQFEDTTERDPLPPVFTVTVTATDAEGETVSDTFTITISALDRANLTLGIVVAPDPAMLNDQLRWTFTASNPQGPQDGANVELNGSFVGSGLTVTNDVAGNCNIQSGGNQVTDFSCVIGAMPVGGSAVIILNTATSDAGDVVAFATAAGANPVPIDPNPDDNAKQKAVGVAEAFSNGAVQVLGNSNVLSIAAGDVNNDLSTDLVVGTGPGEPIRIYLSSGFRDFSATPITLNNTSAHEGVALADFDNNGTLDLVVAAGGGAADMVYSNNGSGTFSPMATLGATFSQDVAIGDFDDNGNMDIAFATTTKNPVYFGDGSGGFTLAAELGTADSRAVAVGKLDSNSRDDLVFANVGSGSRIWTKNSGNGFTSRDILNIGDASSVALADFGGNARPDLVFGRIPMGSDDIASNPVLINSGNGTFGNPRNRVGSAPTLDVLAGDVSGDGSPDLVFINASGLHQTWNADGNNFTLHSEQIVDGGALAGTLTELGMTDVGEPVAIDLAMGGPVASGAGIFLNDGFGNLGRGDAVPPTMVLNGSDPLDVPSGTTFVDPKATAQDNIDGNISNAVVATGVVNMAVVGSYTVTYNVSDFAGNSAPPISRTVNVTPSTGTGGGGGGAISPLALFVVTGAFLLYYYSATRNRRRQPARLKKAERIQKEQ